MTEQTLAELITDARALDRACQDMIFEAERDLVRVPANRPNRPAEVNPPARSSSTPYRDMP